MIKKTRYISCTSQVLWSVLKLSQDIGYSVLISFVQDAMNLDPLIRSVKNDRDMIPAAANWLSPPEGQPEDQGLYI